MTDHNLAQTNHLASHTPNSYADAYQPPAANSGAGDDMSDLAGMPPTAAAAVPVSAAPIMPEAENDAPVNLSEKLEDQNIFYLLGVQGSDEEKEAFLDELQQVIWEDFLDRDVKLLITEAEQSELDAIMAKKELTSEQQQEEVLVFLDKLIPDLESIMLEKALELKEDMVRERVAGMREFYADQPEKMSQLGKAEELMNQAQWRAAAEVLNSLS